MSFGRLVYYTAILAGWSAFAAWLIAETTIHNRLPAIEVLLTGGIVGAAIGCAVNVAASLSNFSLQSFVLRALPGLIGGAIGGAVGGYVGDLAYEMGLPRCLGWMLMGVGIGVLEGVQEKSLNKIRNGLIGGAVGGLLGGILFDPIQKLVASGNGMSSRAIAFVVLGLAIGACIGLAQVVLKEAWLTVVDGYRPGRQLILSRPVTLLGRAEYLPLPFIGAMNRDVALEHAKVTRQSDGGFVLEDLGAGPQVSLNQKPLASSTLLSDGDIIKIGPNIIRFNERHARHGSDGDAKADQVPSQTKSQAPSPAPPPSYPQGVRTLAPITLSTTAVTREPAVSVVRPTVTPPPPPPPRSFGPVSPLPPVSQAPTPPRPTGGSRPPPPPPPPPPKR